jgi:ADP-ribose pyrophosphatase YjhB (NUDIX family)
MSIFDTYCYLSYVIFGLDRFEEGIMEIKIFDYLKNPLVGAVACLIESNNGILLVRERNGKLGFPGGSQGKNDKTLLRTVIREVREETKLRVRPTHIVCLDEKTNDNKHIHGVVFYTKIVSGKESPGAEISELGWYSRAQIRSLHDQGELRGDYILRVVNHYFKNGKIPLKRLVLS